MTWSISINGHSNNNDNNVSEAKLLQEAFTRIVTELRDSGMFVTSGAVFTNHGTLTIAQVLNV